LLIAGLDAHICDKCILQAHGIVKEETSEDKEETKFDVELYPPKKIKAFLDEYVIGQESAKKYFLLPFTTITKESIIPNPKARLKYKKAMSFWWGKRAQEKPSWHRPYPNCSKFLWLLSMPLC
jgi:ATP-dependent Clp protease ATP-binding subunit ClpX